jgi:hypothetical protein
MMTNQQLSFLDIGGCRAFGAIDHIEAHALSFLEGFKPVSLNCGMVDKHVFAPILRDKAKTLRIIKPFHSSFSHCHYSSLVVRKTHGLVVGPASGPLVLYRAVTMARYIIKS